MSSSPSRPSLHPVDPLPSRPPRAPCYAPRRAPRLVRPNHLDFLGRFRRYQCDPYRRLHPPRPHANPPLLPRRPLGHPRLSGRSQRVVLRPRRRSHLVPWPNPPLRRHLGHLRHHRHPPVPPVDYPRQTPLWHRRCPQRHRFHRPDGLVRLDNQAGPKGRGAYNRQVITLTGTGRVSTGRFSTTSFHPAASAHGRNSSPVCRPGSPSSTSPPGARCFRKNGSK